MTGGGQSGEEKKARWTGTARWLRDPATALIAAALLLPLVCFGLAAWQSYDVTLRAATLRADRTARVLEEHAVKAFETHRLAIQEVNIRLRFVDWSRAEDRTDLSKLLRQLQDELDQIATISVVDAEGNLKASSRMNPGDPPMNFGDRDWFKAIKSNDRLGLFVSRSYSGRLSGLAIFNVAARVGIKPGAPFAGGISVSVDRGYFERFYETLEPSLDHSVVLVREDGQILARVPASENATELPPDSLLRLHMREAPYGVYTGVSRLDGVDRIAAYRKVGVYPVYVRFGISKWGALAPWRQSLFAYGLVAALASLFLVGVSLLALKQTKRERLARRRWEETAAALQTEAAERTRVEGQLRQAQKMEAVGRLTGGVAHDFNNLLTAVIGSLDLVRRRGDGIDARNIGLITNALEGAQRAAALTSRLLAFSRQQPLQPTRIDPNALVVGMTDLLRRTLGETIRIETVLTNAPWPVMADPNQLESAVLNLAVNARDAMPGGGTLTIETSNVTLDADYAAARSEVVPGDYVLTAVTDTGAGMPADVIANIFEPFFTTKPVGKGTGLGLSQVYGFVKQSGGHISVHSEVGHGSVFKLYLPRLQEAAMAPVFAPKTEPATPLRRGQGETILLVEDEPMVGQIGVAALEEAGYRVLLAPDGAVALDLVRGAPEIALLFTDVVLPGPMNGRVLADAIHELRPDLPVLFTTGYTRDEAFHRGRLDRGAAFLPKPFTSAALVAKVGDLLASRQARRSERLAAL